VLRAMFLRSSISEIPVFEIPRRYLGHDPTLPFTLCLRLHAPSLKDEQRQETEACAGRERADWSPELARFLSSHFSSETVKPSPHT
jgi:hypothetical protein